MSSGGTSRRVPGPVVWLLSALAVFAVAVALSTVIRNARRVPSAELPRGLTPRATDTSLVRFRRGTHGRLRRLERRLVRLRQGARTLSPQQESALQASDSALTAIRAELVLLDTMTGPGRVEYARRIRRAYTELKKKVYALGRSVALQQTEPNLDSLELELRRLLDD